MTGIQEIITIGFLIVCIFFIPRLFRGSKSTSGYHKNIKSISKMSGKFRLGIVISVILPFISAFVLKPWEGNLIVFMFFGIMPVAVGWAGVWVGAGFKK
ncbi:MAG: hypothetical protein HQK67_03805 [Desulfamplus sp.]|nr:hypothetical protein [Desulfamplus sp.]